MSTDAPAAPKSRRKSSTLDKGGPEPEENGREDVVLVDDDADLTKGEGPATSRQRQDVENAEKAKADVQKSREQEIEEAREELNKLEPASEPVRWVIGKPPEFGGTEKQFSIYVQDELPWMARNRFFSLVAKTFSEAIKESGGNIGSMSDVFGDAEAGSLIDRGRRLSQRDFGDAASFMSMAMELISYSPNFLTECYLIWLNVPRDERGWARLRFNEAWKPEEDKWGLKDEDHMKLIQTFIDQNYEGIRHFFTVELPALGRRVALHEKSKDRQTASKDRESE